MNDKMKTRNLRNIEVSSIGMGCMGFTHGYGELPSEDAAIRIIQSAYENHGCTYFDTAENYGPYINERLVGKAVRPFRDKIVLATKFTPEIFLKGKKFQRARPAERGYAMLWRLPCNDSRLIT